MTRRRHLAALFAPAAALLLAACAQSQSSPSVAPVAKSAPPAADAALDAAPTSLAAQLAALGAAEAQLDRMLLRSPRTTSGTTDDGKKKDSAPEQHEKSAGAAPRAEEARGPASFRAGVSAGVDGESAADPCVTACSALVSMQRATQHLCDLTGDGDDVCRNARARVAGATDRVSASCPACPSAP